MAYVFLCAAVMACGAVIGATYRDTFHLHSWIMPCSLSQLVGRNTKNKASNFLDTLRWRVIDGDTLFCENTSVRITGYNAPGKDGRDAACQTEQSWGRAAKGYLEERLKHSDWQMRRHYTDTLTDQYGRTLAALLVDQGRYVGDEMIALGYALPASITAGKDFWCEKTIPLYAIQE
ncbi:MAG: thermonuclease family protein [Pseudomonadota bacterium]